MGINATIAKVITLPEVKAQFEEQGTEAAGGTQAELAKLLRDDYARFSDLAGTVTVAYSAYSYDAAARLTNLQHKNSSGTILANFTYTYDQASRMTSQVVNGSTTSYSYDAANELTADGATNWTYDSTGNRTNAGFSQGSNQGDQLSTDGIWTYSYDAEGDLTQKSKGPSAETWV